MTPPDWHEMRRRYDEGDRRLTLENERLTIALAAEREIVEAFADRLGFDALVALTKAILDAHYPEDLMRDHPWFAGDVGPRFTLALREALAMLPPEPNHRSILS